MGYVVPFMNGKGGTGKSVLARAYAVREAARAGAKVLIADLDDVQRTIEKLGRIASQTQWPQAGNPRRGGNAACGLRYGGPFPTCSSLMHPAGPTAKP